MNAGGSLTAPNTAKEPNIHEELKSDATQS